MKNKSIAILSIVAIFSIILLFSACDLNSKIIAKDESTTEALAGTTITDDTAQTVVLSTQLSDSEVQEILEDAGVGEFDENSKNLTPEQKKVIETHFNTQGKQVKFDDGAISVVTTTQSTTATTQANTTTKPNTITQPNTTTTRPTTTTQTTIAATVVVKSVALSESKKSLKVGENTILSTSIEPSNAKDKSVRWESSNPGVAFVDESGQVIALKKGNATITCIANGAPTVKATCAITVKTGALVSYLYDARGYFYVEDDPWQRYFGFNRLYDIGAQYAFMYYNTVRVKFKYDGLDWMVQMWKGQYGYVFIGSEIGVYTKPQSRLIDQYDCASDANSLKMEMTLYRHDKRLFATDYGTRWWVTGFVPGTIIDLNGSYGDRSQLILTSRITLKDAEMTNAFVKALKAQGFKDEGYEGPSTPDRFMVTGNDVYSCWRYLAQAPVSITFDPANGAAKTSKQMECGATLAPPELTKEGYTFTGWSPEVPSFVPGKDTVYTAKWTINSYTISFDANSGTGTLSPVTQAYNTSMTLPTSGFEMPGCTFIGWNTVPYATYVLTGYRIPACDETLYAIYTVNEVPVI